MNLYRHFSEKNKFERTAPSQAAGYRSPVFENGMQSVLLIPAFTVMRNSRQGEENAILKV
jgi:hypothetical protein